MGTITFPSLGISVDPPGYFSIGPLQIHFYGVLIAIGLALAVCYAARRSDRAGLSADDLTDGVLWVTPFAIVCARLYYCIFNWDIYGADPIQILEIWNGGLAIFGGVLGAVAGTMVFCRVKKCSLPALLDLVLISFLIGQCIGRWGNFVNREAYGAETDTFLRMGLEDWYGNVRYYHPTFLYESMWNLAGFLILNALYPRRHYDGQIALGYCVWYGFGRALIEGLREDSLYLGSLRISQVLAAVICIGGTILLLVNWKKRAPLAQERYLKSLSGEEAS